MKDSIALLNRHLDGATLTAEEMQQLSDWIAASPENAQIAAQLSVVYECIDGQLSVPNLLERLTRSNDVGLHRSIAVALRDLEVINPRRAALGRGRFAFSPLAIAAAVLIGVSFAAWAVTREGRMHGENGTAGIAQEEPGGRGTAIGTVSDAIDAHLKNGDAVASGSLVQSNERIVLTKGVLQIVTTSGTRVVLEAPAEVVFLNAYEGQLVSGKLVARVEEEAAKFTVRTPTATIYDLGTEFGVRVDRDKATTVAVLDGVVELHSAIKPVDGETQSTTLVAGREGYVDPAGRVRSTIRTLRNEREFIRPDEVVALRDAHRGSARAVQLKRFYNLQRVDGLVAFQKFDVDIDGNAANFGFRTPPYRTRRQAVAGVAIVPSGWSAGAIRVAPGMPVFLDLANSQDSTMARAGMLNDRGLVGRSGAEAWFAWRMCAESIDSLNADAGVSLMFGDEQLTQEPIFAGFAGATGRRALIAHVGSRSIESELDFDPTQSGVQQPLPDTEPHRWIVRVTFGERVDSVSVWCDISLDAIRTTPPLAEVNHAHIVLDRLRLYAGSEGPAWQFDDFYVAASLDALSAAIDTQNRDTIARKSASY